MSSFLFSYFFVCEYLTPVISWPCSNFVFICWFESWIILFLFHLHTKEICRCKGRSVLCNLQLTLLSSQPFCQLIIISARFWNFWERKSYCISWFNFLFFCSIILKQFLEYKLNFARKYHLAKKRFMIQISKISDIRDSIELIENCGGELNNFEETSTSKICEILNQW